MRPESDKLNRGEYQPLFSVIVPTYNRSERLMHALESIFKQTLRNFEVIVIDDGSIDDTVQRIHSDERPVRLIRQENQGAGAARNRGAGEARGKWLAFLDSDDEWLPVYLEEQRNNILSHPACRLHMMNSCQLHDGGKTVNSFEDSRAAGVPANGGCVPDDPFRFVVENYLFFIQPTIIDKELFMRLGGFNEKLVVGEDFDLIARAAAQAPAAFYNTISVNIVRQSEGHPSLTAQYFSDEISAGVQMQKVFASLLASQQCRSHTRIIRQAYGCSMRAHGNVYLKKGWRRLALQSYYHAWKIDGTWRSFVRMLMTILPVVLVSKSIRNTKNH